MNGSNDIHANVFKEEARELLTELENSLLELEESPEDSELVGKVFRAMHTIKGSGAMFGFDDVARVTHEVENVYDKVRNGELTVTKPLISHTLNARDLIKSMLDDASEGPSLQSAMEETINVFRRLASGSDKEIGFEADPRPSTLPPRADVQEHPSGVAATYRIRFTPQADIFNTGANPLLLLNELRTLGECAVVGQRDAIPTLEQIEPEQCYARWDIILTTDQGVNAVKDVFIFVEDLCEIQIDLVEQEAGSNDVQPELGSRRLGEILLDRGDITEQQLQSVLDEKKLIGQLLVEKKIVTPDKIESALVEQEHVRKVREKQRDKEDSASSIRVPAHRLDTMVNLVGELVTVQARLSQTAALAGASDLTSIAEEVERLTVELRDNVLNIRMLPIGTTFGRFKRLVRDLSQELSKEIELVTEGADTELDKTVIEKLNEPLVHLIRNSIDHGIEMPDERESVGKPRVGAITLSAVHSGAHVVVTIRDDGKGLDKEAILAKAADKGLASAGAELSDKEIFGFIFHPGFSTAKRVTSVSGRGVGMDVVRKAIDALRGSIDVSSEKGKGTMVTIKLPLTLAIVEGLLVTLGEDKFVLPLSIVEECVELTGDDTKKSHGRNLANIRGEIVPYVRLRKEFAIPGDAPSVEHIVVTGVNGDRVGFVVDSVIGEHQTVIKNLGKAYRNVEGISGATILGDGKVALIVDAPRLLRNVELAEAVFG